MPTFIPVQYHSRLYPQGIEPKVTEVAAHFAASPCHAQTPYSLHTEYAAGNRSMTSPAVQGLEMIIQSQHRGIPMLWTNAQWVAEFGEFLQRMVSPYLAPQVIEIHPPFRDAQPDVESFLDIYAPFEEAMTALYPNTEIVIENRHGTKYHQSQFLIWKNEDIFSLAEAIQKRGFRLRLCLDIPQLLGAHIRMNLRPENVDRVISTAAEAMPMVRSIHLWGRKKSAAGHFIAHQGDFNTYFEDHPEAKPAFLEALFKLCDDDLTRYLVPEVNSSDEHLANIVNDLTASGFRFI